MCYPGSCFLSFLKMGVILPFAQSPGTSPDHHEFSNAMEIGLPITSASSLRTLVWISSGPIDSVCSSFSNGHQPDLHLQWGRLCSPSSCLAVHPLEVWGESSQFKNPLLTKCLLPITSAALAVLYGARTPTFSVLAAKMGVLYAHASNCPHRVIALPCDLN